MSWEVVVHNQTDKPVTFILFQENRTIDQNSFSTVWYKETAHAGHKAGPFLVPDEVKVSVEASTEDGKILLGPEDIAKGERWEYDESKDSLTPLEEEFDEDDDVATIVSKEGNTTTMHISVWKAGKRIFTQKEFEGGQTLVVDISKKIYIASVEEHKFHQGDQFQILVLEETPTAFELKAAEGVVGNVVNIVIKTQVIFTS